ncbi:C-type lectin mannose-binding isoform-like [Diabrotica virgifera virgifera]|uniref:C-type lectin mannose-binding isoform-like n=1 Tax=Diabrotica virgifera virgifera TaxID=50390 RepID=A0A6P7F190_DIAVI|nr:C-type lectin mannose-binding isoform-like [Diabrotica virgifera virgifera]
MLSFATLLFLFTSILVSESQGDTCPAQSPKNVYYLGDKQVTWSDAIIACQAVGMSLVSIQSQAKQDEIINYLEVRKVNYTGLDNSIWISGNRRLDKVKWFWLAVEPIIYTNFLPGEPNNSGGNEECLTVVYSGRPGWNDIACSSKFYPLCEKEICCAGCNCCS